MRSTEPVHEDRESERQRQRILTLEKNRAWDGGMSVGLSFDQKGPLVDS